MHFTSRSSAGVSLLAALRVTISAMADTLPAALAHAHQPNRELPAAQLARDGKLNEQAVGLVTTLDVLNAQQDVLAAELAAIGADHDTILASYTLLAATGHLQTSTLALPAEPYEPSVHYDAVHRQWFGTKARSAR